MKVQPARPPLGIHFGNHLKWQLFRLLEKISDLRGNNTADQLQMRIPDSPRPALWVFVSTIGELNAIEPFLRRLAGRLNHLQLVLITDHPHYHASYHARYPDAEVCITRGHSEDAGTLAKHYPARALVVAEIPCLPSDAPCRFSVAFAMEAKRLGACAMVVNGWLYHYKPACRMDAIERVLLQRAYLRAFDVLCVQTEECRNRLIAAGAPPNRVVVTGNIKFDSMQRGQWNVADAHSPRLLRALIESARPTVVAGCVTSLSEQEMVLDAFAQVRQSQPSALLVLAPRHPEVAERMRSLRELLFTRALNPAFRSTLEDEPLSDAVDCLVLDTIGDLRDFYAAATVAHVGVDHNVLEPLAFGRPVSVAPGWDATYPSYPVYRMLCAESALLEAEDAARLAEHWVNAFAEGGRHSGGATLAQAALERARGAVERNFTAIQPCIEAAS